MAEATLQDVEAAPNAPSLALTRYRRFKVDLFATSVNDIEVGLFRQTHHRAKSSQFTKDMDVIGQVLVDGERTGVLAYRTGLWDKREGTKRRLVIKLFNETMNWRGTMDMMVGRSLQLTHGADGVPMPAYSVNVAKHDQVIQVERSADKWALWPEKFSFCVMDDAGVRFYKLRQHLVSIGQDYSIYDGQDRWIGRLDGKLLSFGGLWKVKLRKGYEDQKLDATLQLFCAMLRFNKAARRHVRDLSGQMRRGAIEADLDHYERDLYMNPRRAR